MKRPRWMREAIAAGKEFHVLRQDPVQHNTRNLVATGGVLAGIGLTVALAMVIPTVPYLLVAPWVLGALYFSLFILVVHECSHDMFLVSSDRSQQKRWNRLVGQVFCAPFFTDYIKHWEEGHLTHHLRPCEPDDPQDRDPIVGVELARRMALLLIPGSIVALNPSNQYGFNPVRLGLGLATLVLPAVVAGAVFGWAATGAILLGMHTLAAFNLLKKTQEHGGGLASATDPLMRSRTYFYPLQAVASPFGIHYHFEHHANFRVPWYRLPEYHEKLRAIVPEHVQPWVFHHRYLDQALGRFPPIPESLVYPAQAAASEPAA